MKPIEFKTRDELLDFARLLEDSSINKALEALLTKNDPIDFIYEDASPYKPYKGKGAYGDYIEEQYFGKKNDNASIPDFDNIGIELKVSPLRILKSGEYTVKERLVLNHFTFKDIVKETFETSHFLKKNAHLLLIFYVHENTGNFGEYKVNLVDFWDTIENDFNQIKDDWNFIVNKIKTGKAHELSEGDTYYLGACTKGGNKLSSMQEQPFSHELAPGRALCFKSSYIKSIYKILLNKKANRPKLKYLQDNLEWRPLPDLLHYRLDKYLGKSGLEIAAMLNKTPAKIYKSFYGDLSRYMLGLSRNSNTYHELEAGNIQIKSIRIEYDGTVNESMSFRNIYFEDIIDEDWEDSLFYEELTSKFILMFFKKMDKLSEDYYFDGFLIWNMPEKDISEAKKVWEDTKEKIQKGDYEHFFKISDGNVAHVRPKATKQNPKMKTPQGTFERKKAFWLNNDYITQNIVLPYLGGKNNKPLI